MNYYEILGVTRNASAEEISEAYRSLARKHHPDMHQDASAKQEHATVFKRVSEAFSILNDPTKKSQYDALGICR